jgi:pimeloyl-ACP methyl ester carboxylesterase
MTDLLHDYRTNPTRYPQWQEYLRRHQPPTLLVWGRNDAIFPEAGAHPFARDLTAVDLNLLDTGHFALEDHADVIAAHIRRFAARR